MLSVFIKKYFVEVLLGIILASVILFSFSTLTTKPRFWIDEAKSIELAKSWQSFGKLDLEVAPGVFSGVPEVLQSTGYSVTIPLAAFFKVFGFGLEQARVYMILWMAAALIAAFFIGRTILGARNSILAILLISTFASFYDSGRTVVGEIPGFLFLLFGLYAWLKKNNYWLAGFWLGLAVVTKPSVYGLIIPAIGLTILLAEGNTLNFWKRVGRLALGMLPAAAGWIAATLESPLAIESWSRIANFYENPYDAVSISENVIHNLLNAPFSTTLIYFGFWFLILGSAYYWVREKNQKLLFSFVFWYSIFAFGYYLRSPGWLRYILVAELLILFSLPSAVSIIFERFPKRLVVYLVILLTAIQLIHLFTGAEIFYSDLDIKASKFLNEQFPDESIGVLDSLTLATLLKHNQRFLVAEMVGLPQIGKNPLLAEPLPDIIVSDEDNKFFKEGLGIINNNYLLVKEIGGYYDIYRRI